MRIALGLGFVFPVLDRLGLLGPAGSPGVAWGEWKNFLTYTGQLMPYAGKDIVGIGGLFATMAEAILGAALILGIKTRVAAIASAALTAFFGLSMAVFIDPMAPVGYPVYVFTASSLLLASLDDYAFSLDRVLGQKKR